MSGRSRQQSVVLLLVVLAALAVWGCGGGDEATTSSTSAGVTTTAGSGAGSGGNSMVGSDIGTTPDTPPEFVEAYATRPIVLLFYVPGGADDASVLGSLDGLKSAFPRYLFLEYDYKNPDAYGDLSALLKVDYPPQLVLIDSRGVIQEIWNGYVDEGTLNQSLVNLGRD